MGLWLLKKSFRGVSAENRRARKPYKRLSRNWDTFTFSRNHQHRSFSTATGCYRQLAEIGTGKKRTNVFLAHTSGDEKTLKLVSLTPLLPGCFLLQMRP